MGKYAINVKADGAWTFEVSQPRPTTGQAVPPLTLTGTGNDVLGPFKATGALRVAMKHDGTSNFIVVPFTLLGRDGSLANAIGPFAGVQVYKPGGLFFIRLQADGNWSLDFATL